MMVETMLESSQDFGMSNGALPQWKRELLQRRAARSRPAPAPAPSAPAPAPPEDEELRYGPGIVKRLKSRYLSLALRDAPRRRPSVLRRATSLEHLLDERPPPAPRPPTAARAPRPVSLAAPPALLPAPRRDIVKRARSVDALSRLDSRDDPHPPSPSPPPPHEPAPPSPQSGTPAPSVFSAPAPPPRAPPPPPVPASRPPMSRNARPPRRPAPLLRETERPPPDVVRSALRKFESVPTRRPAPAARVSAVLRGLEGPRTSTPEPREAPPPLPRSPTPPLEAVAPLAFDDQDGAVASAEARPVSRAALEGIARAGSSMRFAFPAPRHGSHLPPLAAANAVLLGRARRVGVIRPMPAPTIRSPEPPLDEDQKLTSPPPTPRLASPAPPEPEPSPTLRSDRKDWPPSALVEPIPRSPPEERIRESPQPESMRDRDPEPVEPRPKIEKPLMNGHAEPRPPGGNVISRLGGADIERAWNGSPDRKAIEPKEKKIVAESKEQKTAAPWAGGSPLGGRRGRALPPAATSVVFNFSGRKEVPDYIENDGIILRASRRTKLKAGETGVVVLKPGAGRGGDSSDEGETDLGPPEPCLVRFVNDNVLINGRSCIAARPDRDRLAKLKLQFDDSLTRTFEYPSETSLCEDPDDPDGPPVTPATPAVTPGVTPAAPTPQAHNAALLANTHMTMGALSRYTPSKTAAAAFTLGVTRHTPTHTPTENGNGDANTGEAAVSNENDTALQEEDTGDARPCGADARSWSASRTLTTDLLFW